MSRFLTEGTEVGQTSGPSDPNPIAEPPVNIRKNSNTNSTPSRRNLALDNGEGGLPASFSATPITGTPDLRALRAQYAAVGTPPLPNIPPRGAGGVTPTSRGREGAPGNGSGTGNAGGNGTPIDPSPLGFVGSGTPSSRPGPQAVGGLSATRGLSDQSSNALGLTGLEDLLPEEKAKVLERHLRTKPVSDESVPSATKSTSGSLLDVPTGSDVDAGTPGALKSRRPSTVQHIDSETFPIPYDAHGADVTHDIYKWHADQRRQANRFRSASFSGPSQPPPPEFQHIHEPGGFRRNYLLLQNNGEAPPVLNNFIDFLLLFGHFAGEDLEEEEEDKDSDEEEVSNAVVARPAETREPTESTALLDSSRSRSRHRKGSLSRTRQGSANVTQAVLMLLKSFIGTGVLFLGKAFYNGGLLFSLIVFTFIACISLYSFLLLVKTKFVVSGSFGDIGGTLYGPWMRYVILGSIVVSQIGFVAAYTIFVAENLQAFVYGVTHCLKLIPTQYFILAQLVVFLPFALVRDLAKLSGTALVADAFILAGLVYIFGSEIAIVSGRGIADVKMFNPKDFSLFIGTAVFSFEGIGLVIPITDAMKEPHKFPKALTGVMAFLLFLFGGAGALAYLTFGSKIQTVVLVNLDSTSKMVQSVQFLYALAILLSVPLQLFPAVRILENGLFTKSGKSDFKVKWLKNMFRFCMVFVCTLISWVGAGDLDKFVAFVGCFACVPLCYVYPAMLHYKACARTRRQKVADITLIVFGLVVAAYTTIQTVKLIMEPTPVTGPSQPSCRND